TTWAEYKKHIEKDPALTRRFQVVQVGEPSEARAILMMRGITSKMEQHHRVQILDEALEAAVKLSSRYIPARQLPDKAVSLLDTACARVAVSQHATPAEVEDSRRRIEMLETELEIIGREKAVGIDTAQREAAVEAQLDEERRRLAELEVRWEDEKRIVDRILALRASLRGDGPVDGAQDVPESDGSTDGDGITDDRRKAMLDELAGLQRELEALQGERPLILPSVDRQAVASVVQDWTGI